MCKKPAESQKGNRWGKKSAKWALHRGATGAMGSLGNSLPSAFRGGRSPAVTVIAVIKVNHILQLAHMTFFSLHMGTEMDFLVVFEDNGFKDFTGGLVTHFSFQCWKRKLRLFC